MNPTAAREVIVPEALAGERLDRAIAALAPGVSRGEARRLIAAGVVFVDGKRTGIQSRLVRAGERLSWQSPIVLAERADVGVEPRIVVERPELWIVDKPAGMPVEPTRLGKHGTLQAWLLRAFWRRVHHSSAGHGDQRPHRRGAHARGAGAAERAVRGA